MKFDIRDLHRIVLNIDEFLENLLRKDRASLMGVIEVTFTSAP
jgi:hypothetical protein